LETTELNEFRLAIPGNPKASAKMARDPQQVKGEKADELKRACGRRDAKEKAVLQSEI